MPVHRLLSWPFTQLHQPISQIIQQGVGQKRLLLKSCVSCSYFKDSTRNSIANQEAQSYSSSGSAIQSALMEAITSFSSDPERKKVKNKTVEEKWAEMSRLTEALPPIADSYAGRSVPVLNGDVARAYSRLSGILSRNRVWQELRQTARHEKKGDKRRRLKSERWRRRFRNEVNLKVKLVKDIRRRNT